MYNNLKILITNQQKSKVKLNLIKSIAKDTLNNLGCNDNAELSILLTDNTGIHKLNKKYLKKDKPTDILSFPIGDTSHFPIGDTSHIFSLSLQSKNMGSVPNLMLGDIVISVEMTQKQSQELGITVDEEISKLLIHGILHLFGFDHEKGKREAVKMRKEEERLLGRIRNK